MSDGHDQRLPWMPGVRVHGVRPKVTRMSWFPYMLRVGVQDASVERISEIGNHSMETFKRTRRGLAALGAELLTTLIMGHV